MNISSSRIINPYSLTPVWLSANRWCKLRWKDFRWRDDFWGEKMMMQIAVKRLSGERWLQRKDDDYKICCKNAPFSDLYHQWYHHNKTKFLHIWCKSLWKDYRWILSSSSITSNIITIILVLGSIPKIRGSTKFFKDHHNHQYHHPLGAREHSQDQRIDHDEPLHKSSEKKGRPVIQTNFPWFQSHRKPNKRKYP